MPYIDTHAHLDDDRFAGDLDTVLHRAVAAGLDKIITIATTAQSAQSAVQLAAAHSMLFASVGIQPNHVAEAAPGDWDEIVRLAGERKVVALGETGLDRHWDFTPFPMQEDYFARHLKLSRTRRLPVVIHCRKAEPDVERMLRADFDKFGPIQGVLHSYTGDWPSAEACLAMGLYVSFAGMLTYKNADDIRSVAEKVPLDRLLVETDSPYLVPVPLRGKEKRNEPGNVVHTAACLANVKGVSPEELAAITSANARKLFNI